MTAPTLSARAIARWIVYEVGAMLHGSAEAKAMETAIATAIRVERKDAVYLTKAEATAALEAIGQMTDGNGRDYSSWRAQTSGTPAQWKALLAAEDRIKRAHKPLK